MSNKRVSSDQHNDADPGNSDDDQGDDRCMEEDCEESEDEDDRKPAARASTEEPPKKKRRRRRVISTLQESKWQQMYQRLVAYKEKNGNALVPNRYAKDTSLGAWVATQRRNYRVFMSGSDEPSGMTAERVRSLEAIGFQWSTTDPRHEPWEVRYEEIKAFVHKYGHAEIPMRWEENVQLSNWVSKQRQDYKLRMKGKSTRLTDERMKLLNDLGFKWHIPRKGRKIKQKTIPVIKRDTNRETASKEAEDPQPDEELREDPVAPSTGSDPSVPTGAGTADTDSPFEQNQITGMPSNRGPTLRSAAAANLPTQQSELQAIANPSSGDMNTPSGIQNAITRLATGANGAAASLGQLSGSAPMNVRQALLSNAFGLSPAVQPSAPAAAAQAPAATLLLPIHLGNVLAAAQQAQQVQQAQRVVMPWQNNALASLGLQLVGLPAQTAPPPTAASIAARALATQVVTALAGAQQTQQQPQPQGQQLLAANVMASLQQQLPSSSAFSSNQPVASLGLLQPQQQQQQQAGTGIGAAPPQLIQSLATLLSGGSTNQQLLAGGAGDLHQGYSIASQQQATQSQNAMHLLGNLNQNQAPSPPGHQQQPPQQQDTNGPQGQLEPPGHANPPSPSSP